MTKAAIPPLYACLVLVALLVRWVIPQRLPIAQRYAASVVSGQRNIPIVSQFQSLFPKAEHFISYYTAEYGPPTWNSKVGIAGRYRLQVQFPIEIDESSNAVRQTGTAAFFLNEVTSVITLSNGQHEIRYGRDIKFDEAQWLRLREAQGDIGISGIPKPIQPEPGFDEIKDSAMNVEVLRFDRTVLQRRNGALSLPVD